MLRPIVTDPGNEKMNKNSHQSPPKQSEHESSLSPFHRGEQAMQQRLGVREQMERFGRRVIHDYMPDQHREFYAQLPFILLGHADRNGWPWASLLFNPPGFITSSDARTLNINALPVSGDPLADTLELGTQLGLLGIELTTRRRNRLSAHIIGSTNTGICLSVDQAFGNCPQYIQTRKLEQFETARLPTSRVEDVATLDSRAQALIQQSDTFFVASYVDNGSNAASEGADISHRGGRPGFIQVDNENTLTIPDYPGNKHFNTFGNFIENGRAGLLFLDFENGHLLTLTGKVEILWNSPETALFKGAQYLWKFHLDHGRWLNNVLPLRWKLDQFSPGCQRTSTWDEVEKLRKSNVQNGN